MEDVPQPRSSPYSVQDEVFIYIGPDDPDKDYHGLHCEVVESFEDDLDRETERDLDRFSYVLREIESGDILPISFRHQDLVPKDIN